MLRSGIAEYISENPTSVSAPRRLPVAVIAAVTGEVFRSGSVVVVIAAVSGEVGAFLPPVSSTLPLQGVTH